MKLIGSVLTPFCYYRNRATGTTGLMICGLQLIKSKKGVSFKMVPFKQWTYKLFKWRVYL